jgi:hypothetical protein
LDVEHRLSNRPSHTASAPGVARSSLVAGKRHEPAICAPAVSVRRSAGAKRSPPPTEANRAKRRRQSGRVRLGASDSADALRRKLELLGQVKTKVNRVWGGIRRAMSDRSHRRRRSRRSSPALAPTSSARPAIYRYWAFAHLRRDVPLCRGSDELGQGAPREDALR